jgi:hypothetical protein
MERAFARLSQKELNGMADNLQRLRGALAEARSK